MINIYTFIIEELIYFAAGYSINDAYESLVIQIEDGSYGYPE